jgi:3-hydroxyacyl-[acyl-carrier protein] dehydratase/trans-2-decenoyl-[acyl-carrier protein] isomerase
VGEVKFTGEVLETVKIAKYIINIKRILKKDETSVGLADGVLLADNKEIYKAKSLKVGLFKGVK